MDIVRQLAEENSLSDFILDTELVGFDIENSRILPFNAIQTRSRKNVTDKDLKTKIAMMAFDILYLNGKPLLKETFEDRRDTLRKHMKERKGQFMHAIGKDTNCFEDLE